MSNIFGLDPLSLTHPATRTLALAFHQADKDLREASGDRPISRIRYDEAERRYYAAMRDLHAAEDAIPGEERRGMAVRSLNDEVAARGLRAEGEYVLCAYRPIGSQRIEGPHMFVSYLRFDSLDAAVAYAEAEIIGPESGFLPWVPTGDSRKPGLVTDVWLKIDRDLGSAHRRINLLGQPWKVLKPVGAIGIQSAWAHAEHVGDRMAEIAFGGRPGDVEVDLVNHAMQA